MFQLQKKQEIQQQRSRNDHCLWDAFVCKRNEHICQENPGAVAKNNGGTNCLGSQRSLDCTNSPFLSQWTRYENLREELEGTQLRLLAMSSDAQQQVSCLTLSIYESIDWQEDTGNLLSSKTLGFKFFSLFYVCVFCLQYARAPSACSSQKRLWVLWNQKYRLLLSSRQSVFLDVLKIEPTSSASETSDFNY